MNGRLRWSILTLCVTPQSGNRVSTSLGNSGLCWTVFVRNRDTVVPEEGNGGDLQTLICVLVARPRRCLTLLNPVPPTKLNGGLSRLHSADEDAVSWLTSYGSWHAYEKKKWTFDHHHWTFDHKQWTFDHEQWTSDHKQWTFDDQQWQSASL